MSRKLDANWPSLPPELLPHILDSACSFGDVRALILTAPIIHSHWRLHAAEISSVVAQRSITSYPQALKLATDQETRKDSRMDDYSKLISFNRRLLQNARIATRAFKIRHPSYEANSQHHLEAAIRAPEGVEFMSGFYEMWSYSRLLQQTSHPRDLRFDQLPQEIFLPIFQIARWTLTLDSDKMMKLLSLFRSLSALSGRPLDPVLGNWNQKYANYPHPWVKACRYVMGCDGGR